MRLQLFSFLLVPFFTSAFSDEQMVLPGSSDASEVYTPLTHADKPTLADLLTIEPSASIFYSYARENELSQLFGNEASSNTLLVPTNKAIMALARKPHQSPAPVKDGVIISEAEFDRLAKTNVERWVSAHIIPRSPISLLPPKTYNTLLEGKNVTFERVDGDESAPEWALVQLDGGVRLTGMKEACNGVMYIIDGTVKTE
ncbi:hypothetical protein B0H21DRAFT_818782 [Amylocystis lapponica]|nr:hypothetical protein B0H21DRAFT_818782 [Amylocystis lapponica]